MSSGTWFPPPVRAVEVPKPFDTGTRLLGVPTVADRVAQTVVAGRIEDRVEPIFHPDSYGYRPGRSALDAVEVCRQRCWKYDWVVEFRYPEVLRQCAVGSGGQGGAGSTPTEPWVVLYLKRWLAAPMQQPDGVLVPRDRGTPQGSPVSPVIANLFMHYAFDPWLVREFPDAPFERYADDGVVHCVSLARAEEVLAALTVADGTGRVWRCTRTRPGSCTARTTSGAGLSGPRRSRSWGTRSGPGSAGSAGTHVPVVPARDQRTSPETDREGGPLLAAAPLDQPHLRGTGGPDQSRGRGMDAVLRPVLPVGVVSAPDAHQWLPGALDPQQVSTIRGYPGSPPRSSPR